MRKIAVQNYLTHPVHVTVVFHPPAAVQFVLSRRQLPVPAGQVIGRAVINAEQGMVTDPISKTANVTFTQKGLGDRIGIVRRILHDDAGMEVVECTIHVPPADGKEE